MTGSEGILGFRVPTTCVVTKGVILGCRVPTTSGGARGEGGKGE